MIPDSAPPDARPHARSDGPPPDGRRPAQPPVDAEAVPDSVLAAITAAVERGGAGDRAGAHRALEDLWEQVGPQGDAFHRCTIAHYVADLQDSVEDELCWDERAMAAVTELTDERLQRVHPSLTVRGFLPSLHLNLANDHRMLGDPDRARIHLAAALDLSDALADDPYGRHLRSGIEHVTQALDDGSTERLGPAAI